MAPLYAPASAGDLKTDVVRRIIRPWSFHLSLAIIHILCTGPFLGLAVFIIAISQGDRQVSPNMDTKLDVLSNAASTLFTMVFGAVVGAALKNFALWRLGNRGMQLGFLEQIMQSRTLFSTISTQLTLCRVNIASLLLPLTWAFSPLGSQACLRLFTRPTMMKAEHVKASYLDTVTWNPLKTNFSTSSLISRYLFASALLGPRGVNDSPMDVLGNVKIPVFKHALAFNDTTWYNIDNLSDANYSARLGVSLGKLPPYGISSMTIETSHMQLNCSKPAQPKEGGKPPKVHFVVETGDYKVNDQLLSKDEYNSIVNFQNWTAHGINILKPSKHTVWTLAVNQIITSNQINNFTFSNWTFGLPGLNYGIAGSMPEGTKRHGSQIVFQNFNAPCHRRMNDSEESKRFTGTSACRNKNITERQQPFTSVCSSYQAYVQSNVSCNVTGDQRLCHVTAQRNSPRSSTASNITFLSFSGNFMTVSLGLAYLTSSPLTRFESDGAAGDTLPLNYGSLFLQGFDSSQIVKKLNSQPWNYTSFDDVDADGFSVRLTQLINTYIQMMYLTYDQDNPKYSMPGWNRNDATNIPVDVTFSHYNDADAIFERTVSVYRVAQGWMTAYLISILVMFLAAVASTVSTLDTNVPDILGYCSSIVTDSIWFRDIDAVSKSKSTWDGMERARKLASVEVGMGQVIQNQGPDSSDRSFSSLTKSSKDALVYDENLFQPRSEKDFEPPIFAFAPPSILKRPQQPIVLGLRGFLIRWLGFDC